MRLTQQVHVRNGVQVEAVPPDFSELDYVPLRTRYPKYKVSTQEDPAEVALLSQLSAHKVPLFPHLRKASSISRPYAPHFFLVSPPKFGNP